MAESRIVNKPGTGWTHVLNSVAQDKRLSLDTRGLFLMMKSFPADWEFSIGGLSTMGNCGRDKIRRMLTELEEAGYLLREQRHDTGGKFSGNTYVLQDHPPTVDGKSDNGEDRCGVSRQREKPLTENPTLTNKEYKYNTPLPPKGGEGQEKRKRPSKYTLQEEAKPILRAWVGDDRELHRTLGDFIELRESLRAINSEKAIKELLRKLDELSEGDRETKLLLIRQSIANSWKSVFPLKGYTVQKPQPPPQAVRRTVANITVCNGEEVVTFGP